MTARVLIVDDLLPNIKLLEARLSAEYSTLSPSPMAPRLWSSAAKVARTSFCSTS